MSKHPIYDGMDKVSAFTLAILTIILAIALVVEFVRAFFANS